MKAGSYGIKLYFIIVDQDGLPLPLDGGVIKLYVQLGNEVKEYDCVIEDAAEGLVSYTTEEGDFPTKGGAEMEVEVSFPGQLFISENKIKEPILKRVKREGV